MKMTELSNEELMCELLLEIRKQLNSTKSDLAKADSLTIEILNRLSRISRLEAENKELKERLKMFKLDDESLDKDWKWEGKL